MLTDMRILELLASKICHDLVSPVGAINNGVELIDDIGADVAEEAMGLIRNSAAQASLRLRLFRLAYGRAGADTNLTFKDVRETLEGHFQGTKTKIHFLTEFPVSTLIERSGGLRCLINLTILAEEALVYGGEIHCTVSTVFPDGGALMVSGRNAGLSAPAMQALTEDVDIELVTPRTIHAYLTGKFLALHQFKLQIAPQQDGSMTIHFASDTKQNASTTVTD